MPLYFVDTVGNEGWVGDDLSLSYDGTRDAAEVIEACIEEVETRDEPDNHVLTELMVEVPVDCEIQTMARVDGHSEGE